MSNNNQISLYKKIDSQFLSDIGFQIHNLLLSYNSDEGEKVIEITQEDNSYIPINKFDSLWSPDINELHLIQKFSFENTQILYGDKNITSSKNKIALAVHIHSKTSNFQKTIKIDTINPKNKKYDYTFSYLFSKGSLRGNIHLAFFLYLEECNEVVDMQANKVGMVLNTNDIHSIEIVVDGDGSEFPISEFEDVNGPLWILEKNWYDVTSDSFSMPYVNLKLNTKHQLFEQIKNGKTPISRALMGDILVQAMTAIVHQVINIEHNNPNDEDSGEASDSILAIVKYWISTYEINTESIFTIGNSMRTYWDRRMIAGGEK